MALSSSVSAAASRPRATRDRNVVLATVLDAESCVGRSLQQSAFRFDGGIVESRVP